MGILIFQFCSLEKISSRVINNKKLQVQYIAKPKMCNFDKNVKS